MPTYNGTNGNDRFNANRTAKNRLRKWRMYGKDGNDILSGGRKNDSLYGGWGRDTLVGGSGNDVLNGGWGHDALMGGTGDDTLIGGFG
ncbi:MAG: hypothetical protein HRT59_12900, partial [Crocosphaera sp.]|nr:hypothetical protein [Crocosphaera sp.]